MGLIEEALLCIDGIEYLLALDEAVLGALGDSVRSERERVIELSHVRWATVNAITAVDLCAAALTKLLNVPWNSRREPSLSDWKRGRLRKFRESTPEAAETWVNSHDRSYNSIVKWSRHRLVHGTIERIGDPPGDRSANLWLFDLKGVHSLRIDGRGIMEISARVAKDSVGRFIAALDAELLAPGEEPLVTD